MSRLEEFGMDCARKPMPPKTREGGKNQSPKQPMNTKHAIQGAFAALLICAASASANLINNGSFESYGGSGFNSNIGAGLTGWTIGNGGGVDIVFSTGVQPYYWQAADGNVSLSLNYFSAESVSQIVTTTPGQSYLLSFFMAAEIYGGPATRTMNVLWDNSTVASPSFQYTGQGPTTMGWTQFNFNVTGTGSDTLSFLSTTSGPYGPALDAVSLVATPEPSTGALAAIASIMIVLYRLKTGKAAEQS